MFELKPLHKEAIPRALEKAERYRLLNEPGEAESICLDILGVDPGNQPALVILLLALTDRFSKGYAVGNSQVQEVLSRIEGLRKSVELLKHASIEEASDYTLPATESHT